MENIFSLSVSQVQPAQNGVLRSLGVPEHQKVSDRISELFSLSMEWFLKLARPVGKMIEISHKDFGTLYQGMGNNAAETPLESIFPRAEKLALMALTLGAEISRKISRFFENRDFAQGAMLDAIASQAAEEASQAVERIFFERFCDQDSVEPSPVVLLYSPGYCGWHISGQKALFAFLYPEEIGINLNPSFLMTPLKSISGVLVAGEKQIHAFRNDFTFCKVCNHHSCIQRMQRIELNAKERNHGYYKPDFPISATGR